MRTMWEGDHRAVSPEGHGEILARGLPQVRLLRLPPRGSRLEALLQSGPHALQEGLS